MRFGGSFAHTSWVIVVIGASLPVVLGLPVCFAWWVFAVLGAVLCVGFGLLVFFALLGLFPLLCWLRGCFAIEIPL